MIAPRFYIPLQRKSLCDESICGYVVFINRLTNIGCQPSDCTLRFKRSNVLLCVSVREIRPQVITQHHIGDLFVNLLAILIYVSLILKQLHYRHFQGAFVKVGHSHSFLFNSSKCQLATLFSMYSAMRFNSFWSRTMRSWKRVCHANSIFFSLAECVTADFNPPITTDNQPCIFAISVICSVRRDVA